MSRICAKVFNGSESMMDCIIYNGKYQIPLNPYKDKLEEYTEFDLELTAVFIDTGVVHDHPWIKESLLESYDLTGEGKEDLHGHGTSSVLIYLSAVSLRSKAKIISIKAFKKNGEGEEKHLVEAIKLACKLRKTNKSIFCINISAGLYNKSFGIMNCIGFCRTCRAAIGAAKRGIIVFAAAGNVPNTTACPARANHPGVVSVTGKSFKNMDLGFGDGRIVFLGETFYDDIDHNLSNEQIFAKYMKN